MSQVRNNVLFEGSSSNPNASGADSFFSLFLEWFTWSCHVSKDQLSADWFFFLHLFNDWFTGALSQSDESDDRWVELADTLTCGFLSAALAHSKNETRGFGEPTWVFFRQNFH